MSPTSTRSADGVLPDAVIRDRNANAYLFAIDLEPQLDAAGVQAWLEQLTQLIDALHTPDVQGNGVATAAVGFGASFFTAGDQPRFGLNASQIPAGLAAPPALPGVASAPADVFLYVMSTSEAAVAAFERGLSLTRGAALASVSVELGYQRFDHREPFGYLDGLRNVIPADRPEVVFVDPERSPEEPSWTAGGTYLAYLKIHQDLDAMAALAPAAQDQVIGRRKANGSRLDLPEGTPVASEGPFTGDTCPAAAHVRKVGPRGELHDQTRIFRRGVPFLTLNADGSVDAGLQFVSFQGTLADFAVLFTRWMTNLNFPAPGTGTDALLAQNLITIEKGGFFFLPPHDDRFIGAPIFDPPPPDPCATGHIVVQKQLLDANGQPVLAELGGIAFQVLESGQPLGGQFTTDSSGRAVSPPVPRGTPLVVREVAPPTGFAPVADTNVTLSGSRQLVTMVNQITPGPGPGPIYSG